MNNFITFLAGIGVGSVVTWALLNNKYRQLAQEEIDSVKEEFRKDVKKEVEPEEKQEIEEPEEEQEENEEMDKYKKLVRDYRKESTMKKKEEDKDMEYDIPYVIPPEEFDTLDNYEVISLTYYQDGVVTDDAGEPMSDEEIEAAIGHDSLNHFGEYEEDSVFVRNDERQTDYEILMDADYYNPQD